MKIKTNCTDNGNVKMDPRNHFENRKSLNFLIIVCFAIFTFFSACKKDYTFTVTFNSNGGSTVAAQTITKGEKTTEPDEPTKEGYTFAGWFTDNVFTDKVIFPFSATSNITLYAKWLVVNWISISNPDELNAIRDNLSGNYFLTTDISLAKYDNWEPIGTDEDNAFTGNLDGNWYKITALSINRPEELYIGLFGCIDNGSVCNLGIEIASGGVNGGKKYLTGSGFVRGAYVGGIVGVINNSTITNCYSSGNVTATAATVNAASGGIAGNVINSVITNCYGSGNVTATNTKDAFSGGIAGYIENSTITNCYSSGNITASLSGGIAGGIASNSVITNCYNSGNITATYWMLALSGGITGYVNNSKINNCYNIGNIDIGNTLTAFCGGISGEVANNSIITNCYSTGNITNIVTDSYSGGIIGYLHNSIITSCAAINPIISSTHYAGRIVGYTDGTEPVISNNFAFYEMQSLGVAFNTNLANHGISKTLKELQTQTTYSGAVNGDGLGGLGWDFTNTWKMPAGGGYPILYWQD